MITWAKASMVRAIKTVAQTAIATIGTSMVISDVDWIMVLSASLLAGILSILTSLAGLPEVEYTKDTEKELSNGLADDELMGGDDIVE